MLTCWALLCSSFALATDVDTPSDAQVAPDVWEPDFSEYGQHPSPGPALREFLEKRQLGTDPPAKDLTGQTTPGGGRYPKQNPPVTGYGGQVWECPNRQWGVSEGGEYNNVCRRVKIENGKCYPFHWSGALKTFVPDRDITCQLWRYNDCTARGDYYTDKKMKEDYLMNATQMALMRGLPVGYVPRVTWPGIENYMDNKMCEFYRINIDYGTPQGFKCFKLGTGGPVGLGT
ncbi:uncharacterized protein AB675_6819 [Cyphellophora attinorum]|uniref:Uncharacterized protein n=1 Tax=Cyphellophora attinorum TaxID=1664694 RepID=A0A0N1HYC8_9EURO|nr:uncharacterized protein AB675_6819 [Phialophora attinorum]KPI43374.1 hypothetical protein AB675_6819 [Phialophora attinorum]